MQAYFHGWRRKAGCVLLLIAGVFVNGWIRSHACYDRLLVPGFGYGLIVQSNGGRLILIAAETEVEFGWECQDPEHLFRFSNLSLIRFRHSIAWQHTFWKITVEFGRFRSGIKYHAAEIPYSCFVFPLTLLSANLLLWPGKPVKKMPPDDAAE